MIFNTNRTTSLGEATTEVEVNESYFGAGSLNFMQESAEDELALFEAAIKSDIDECLIGESATELEALNEGFVQNAAKKIKEMMRKFIEWLKAVTKSAIAKLTEIVLKDNVQFCKSARKRISSMKNYSKFKYSGKALADTTPIDFKLVEESMRAYESAWKDAENAKTAESLESIKAEIEKQKKEFEEKLEKIDEGLTVDAENEGLDFVEKHLKFLEGACKEDVKNIRKLAKEAEVKAAKFVRDAEKAEKSNKEEDEAAKNRLSVMAEIARLLKETCQKDMSVAMSVLKKRIKVARAVVTKAMGASPKNEGFEYTEELIDAMIETANYELDEAFEEMSEGVECDIDDISDDDKEE